jgi:hypothetical protein
MVGLYDLKNKAIGLTDRGGDFTLEIQQKCTLRGAQDHAVFRIDFNHTAGDPGPRTNAGKGRGQGNRRIMVAMTGQGIM